MTVESQALLEESSRLFSHQYGWWSTGVRSMPGSLQGWMVPNWPLDPWGLLQVSISTGGTSVFTPLVTSYHPTWSSLGMFRRSPTLWPTHFWLRSRILEYEALTSWLEHKPVWGDFYRVWWHSHCFRILRRSTGSLVKTNWSSVWSLTWICSPLQFPERRVCYLQGRSQSFRRACCKRLSTHLAPDSPSSDWLHWGSSSTAHSKYWEWLPMLGRIKSRVHFFLLGLNFCRSTWIVWWRRRTCKSIPLWRVLQARIWVEWTWRSTTNSVHCTLCHLTSFSSCSLLAAYCRFYCKYVGLVVQLDQN